MRIEQADPADTRKARECHEVYLAAQRVDEPGGPWLTDRAFGGWLAVGWDGQPSEVWLATEDGSVTGWYRLELADRENLDHANLDLTVHPAARPRPGPAAARGGPRGAEPARHAQRRDPRWHPRRGVRARGRGETGAD
jgi:hypothetical protein